MSDAPASPKMPPPGAAADWTVPQDWASYTPAEQALWDRLFARQSQMLAGRASRAFLGGLDVLRMSRPGIPDFAQLSERLQKLTGWTVVAVPGRVPKEAFFRHLANRTFVAGRFIRRPDQIDYLQEPDIFHDVFGHVPLLGESTFALDDASPHRLSFDLKRVMRTRYRIDDYQQTYFVIDSYADLLGQTLESDFAPLYADLAAAPDIGADTIQPTDLVLTTGTQRHAHRKTLA